MLRKAFWTEKRLEAISKFSLTLCQAFVIAGFLGGVFDKLTTLNHKIFFLAAMFTLFMIGIFLVDLNLIKEMIR